MAEKSKKGKEKPICIGCGAQVRFDLFDSDSIRLESVEGSLCGDCAAALRVKYPKRFERNPEYNFSPNWFDEDSNASPYITVYPVRELTAEQVKRELAGIDAYREQLRASFGGVENVFEVEEVRPMPKLNPFRVSIPNAVRYKNTVLVYGRVHLGKFRKGDLVELRHGNTSRDTTVLLIDEGKKAEGWDPMSAFKEPELDSFKSDKNGISEGLAALMILPSDVADIKAGDLLVAD